MLFAQAVSVYLLRQPLALREVVGIVLIVIGGAILIAA